MSHSVDNRHVGRGRRAVVLVALALLPACSEPVEPERRPRIDGSAPAADSAPAGELAAAADSFVNAISIQTFLGRDLTIYWTAYSSIIRPRLLELGVRHVRERMADNLTAQARMQDLAANGIKLTAGCWPKGTNYTSASHCVARANAHGPDVIDALDGWNEVDNTGSDWAGAWVAWQQTLWSTYKANPTWAAHPIYANSLARANSADLLGNRSDILDYGNLHSYPAGDLPSVVSKSWIPKWNQVAAPKPLIVTETGYHTCPSCGGNGVSQPAQAKYLGRLLFEYFNRGIHRTNIFELIDQGVSNKNRNHNWGLLNNDGTPKPAFTVVKNLIALLRDEGPGFAPGRLDYSLSGALASTHETLLQKRDGRSYVVLWREVRSWDIKSKRDITNSEDAATLILAEPASSLKVFRPGADTLPIQVGGGASIALSVPDEVIVVEVIR